MNPGDELRQININSIFMDPLDLLIVLLGGIQAPLCCPEELKTKLLASDFMTDMDSTVRDQIHIPKKYWFQIASSEDRRRAAINNGSQAIANLSYEKLKCHPRFSSIKNRACVKLLYHLRNSGSHGNKFCFEINGEFKDPGVVRWGTKVIDKDLQNKPAFPNFFSPADFFHLMDDISVLLRIDDDELKKLVATADPAISKPVKIGMPNN